MGNKIVEILSVLTTKSKEISSDILLLDFTVVNAFLIGKENTDDFILVDTGLENSTNYIIKAIDKRFTSKKPKAIVLTHGHFDHVGSVISLTKKWNIPVYAHKLEIPYLIGEKDYPTPDPNVDEGIVAKISPTFPHTAINIKQWLQPLPDDGLIPEANGWRWIHTPGHTEGHVSLFREIDRVLIAGDIISTTKQESLWHVITQKEQIKGPPAYLTPDWEVARSSVKKLKELNPTLIIPSHGKPMYGEKLDNHLDYLVNHFDEIAKPSQGKYFE